MQCFYVLERKKCVKLLPSLNGSGKMVVRHIEDSKKIIRLQQLLRNLSWEIVLRKIQRFKLRKIDGILPLGMLKLPMT